MSQVIRRTCILLATLLVAGTLQAQVEPEKAPDVAAKALRHADLTIPAFYDEIGQLPPQAAAQARERLARLGIAEATARVDRRGGRFVTLLPTEPLVPGRGVGNSLSWADLEVADTPNRAGREQAVWDAFLDYLAVHQDELGIDLDELSAYKVTSHDDGDLYQIYVPRTFDGIPVRDSYVSAVVGQGNLTLMSLNQWGDRGAGSNRPQLTLDEAVLVAEDYLQPLSVTREWGKSELVYVPMARGQAPEGVGNGYRYQLVWSVKRNVEGDAGNWEVLVDAYTGEILALEDTNQYAEAKGGVYPVSNDGTLPDGVEQAGWPMPFMEVGLAITDTGGNYNLAGGQTARFYGPYVNMADNCGTDSLTQANGIDWGTSGGGDCTTPGFGGAGNTHASRTGFYELNKLIEMARGQLPSNLWLQGRLTANMNINNTCNAYWNGSTVNFYRSGGGCANTGEIAGVFDHEWGHGMDQNDATPGIANPSGEGIADVYMALRLNTSCIGRGFRLGIPCNDCAGNLCIDCDGVRDIDYLNYQTGVLHTYTWCNTNCGGSPYCTGQVYSEAIWSLWKRKLQQAPYNYDNNTAWEITNRLTFLGAGATGTWFSGGPPNGGCGGSSGYMNYLAADDDDGNINNGTPHMQAIFAAFDDQEIACSTPSVQDYGCVGVPTDPPDVTFTRNPNSMSLSWSVVTGATKYQVFRTEGVAGCDFGKVKVGETAATSFTDTGLQNGRDYFYVVIPIGGHDACMGPASACTPCFADADCDDGFYCNGEETCNAGNCTAGTPVDCDDGVGCTVDLCNELNNECDHAAWDPFCDDGIACTDDICDYTLDCIYVPVHARCDDGLFCNGSESCLLFAGCQGSCQENGPCASLACDEDADRCFHCSADSDCGGSKSCVDGLCKVCTVADDFESGTTGWANDPASTCTTGAYVAGDPTEMVDIGVTTQIGGSHSGTTSIFTATNTSAGVDDVDGGNCILNSPSWNVSSTSTLSAWFWHGQRDAGDDALGDFFLLEYSTDDGTSWTPLMSIGDMTFDAMWLPVTAQIPVGSDVKLRVQCSDGASAADVVECGIDDVSICAN